MIVILAILGILAGLFLFIRPVFLSKTPSSCNPKISIIIPARNEAHNIGELLDTINNQTYGNFEVLVIDDRSEDGTGDTASSKGARVIRVKEKPEDFLGKPFACYTGYLNSTGDILIFLDADVRLNDRDALSKIVGELENFPGALSVWPCHRIQKLYENFSSIYAIISSMASRSFSLISKRVTIKGLYGPLIAIWRDKYEEIGTHKTIKQEVVEDFKLGNLLASKGIPIKNFLGGNDISFRMYPNGMKDLWKGWTKNSALGAAIVDWNVIIPIVLFLVGSLIPIIYLKTTPYNYLYIMYAYLIWRFLRRVGDFWFIVPIFYPIFVAFTLSIILYSFYATHVLGYVEWKGAKITVKG